MSDGSELERLRAEYEKLKAALANAEPAPEHQSRTKVESPKPPPQPIGTGCLIAFILAVVLFGLVGLCSGGSETPAANTTTPDAVNATSAGEPTAEADPEPRTQWVYSDTEDPMGGSTKTACVTSSDRVHLDFPYDDQEMRLCIRRSPKFGLDAYATLMSDGQILCNSYSQCHIRVRFDAGAPQRWSGGEASDGSSNIIFLENVTRLISSIKSSETMRLELEFYQNGVQTVTFDVRGLEW